MPPDITIIIPNYNMQDYLKLAIRSALTQSLPNLEIVVIDGDSTDNSVNVVESMQKIDSRVRLYVHSKNQGISAARNTGIRNARSRYVTFLDSDDLMAPERVEAIQSLLDTERVPCVFYSDRIRVNPTQTAVKAQTSRASYRPEGMIFSHLLAGRFRFNGAQIALSRSCFDSVGLFDEMLWWAEDTDMALRLSLRFPFRFERLSTYGWRSHLGSSVNSMDKARRMGYEAKVLEKHTLDNLKTLDSGTKKKAFDRLFGCYISGGQWGRLFKTSLIDKQAFISMMTLPKRINAFRYDSEFGT